MIMQNIIRVQQTMILIHKVIEHLQKDCLLNLPIVATKISTGRQT